MADQKISALTSATLPLAGTEVLPIVQSSTTVKVAVDNLTVKNVRSNATTGLLQVTGPAAASTRVMTTPDANFTAARTDAAQSFTGDQTLSTGNLIIGTSGKGIDFSATPGTGTSELLADYEEGTWTPSLVPGTSGSISLSTANGRYTKVGNMVTVVALVISNGVTSPVGELRLSGLPFSIGVGGGGSFAVFAFSLAATAITSLVGTPPNSQTYAVISKYATGGVSDLSSDVQNGTGMLISFSYFV